MSIEAINFLNSIQSIEKTIYLNKSTKISPENFDKFKSSHIEALKNENNIRAYSTHLYRVRKLYVELNKKP